MLNDNKGVKINITADASKATAEMRKLNVGMDNVGKNADKLTATFKKLAVGIAAAFSTKAIANNLKTATDGMISLQNRVNLVTQDAQKTQKVLNSLFDISASTRSDVAGSIDIFNRFGLALKSQNKPVSELLKITETVNQAIQISGSSAESANAALVQLGQGLASGQLRGQELNSVLEQTPRLARAIADGMGIPYENLRKAAEKGLLTAQSVYDAILKEGDKIKREFLILEATTESLVTVMRNERKRAFAEIDKLLGVSRFIKATVLDMTEVYRFIGKNFRFMVLDVKTQIVLLKGEFLLLGASMKRAFHSVINSDTLVGRILKSVVDSVNTARDQIEETLAGRTVKEITLDWTFKLKDYVFGTDEEQGLLGKVKDFTKKIYGFFNDLYVAIVGNSIWPDMWSEIYTVAVSWTNVVSARISNWSNTIYEYFVGLYNDATAKWQELKTAVETKFGTGSIDSIESAWKKASSAVSDYKKSVAERQAIGGESQATIVGQDIRKAYDDLLLDIQTKIDDLRADIEEKGLLGVIRETSAYTSIAKFFRWVKDRFTIFKNNIDQNGLLDTLGIPEYWKRSKAAYDEYIQSQRSGPNPQGEGNTAGFMGQLPTTQEVKERYESIGSTISSTLEKYNIKQQLEDSLPGQIWKKLFVDGIDWAAIQTNWETNLKRVGDKAGGVLGLAIGGGFLFGTKGGRGKLLTGAKFLALFFGAKGIGSDQELADAMRNQVREALELYAAILGFESDNYKADDKGIISINQDDFVADIDTNNGGPLRGALRNFSAAIGGGVLDYFTGKDENSFGGKLKTSLEKAFGDSIDAGLGVIILAMSFSSLARKGVISAAVGVGKAIAAAMFGIVYKTAAANQMLAGLTGALGFGAEDFNQDIKKEMTDREAVIAQHQRKISLLDQEAAHPSTGKHRKEQIKAEKVVLQREMDNHRSLNKFISTNEDKRVADQKKKIQARYNRFGSFAGKAFLTGFLTLGLVDILKIDESDESAAGGLASDINSMIEKALMGAGAGGVIGSVIPGVGTAIGAVVGAGIGLAMALIFDVSAGHAWRRKLDELSVWITDNIFDIEALAGHLGTLIRMIADDFETLLDFAMPAWLAKFQNFINMISDEELKIILEEKAVRREERKRDRLETRIDRITGDIAEQKKLLEKNPEDQATADYIVKLEGELKTAIGDLAGSNRAIEGVRTGDYTANENLELVDNNDPTSFLNQERMAAEAEKMQQERASVQNKLNVLVAENKKLIEAMESGFFKSRPAAGAKAEAKITENQEEIDSLTARRAELNSGIAEILTTLDMTSMKAVRTINTLTGVLDAEILHKQEYVDQLALINEDTLKQMKKRKELQKKQLVLDPSRITRYDLPPNESRDGTIHRAMGGSIRGAGTSTSDSIPAMLSNGEYVVKASAVSKLGVGTMDAINKGVIPEKRFLGGLMGKSKEAPVASYETELDNTTLRPAEMDMKLESMTGKKSSWFKDEVDNRLKSLASWFSSIGIPNFGSGFNPVGGQDYYFNPGLEMFDWPNTKPYASIHTPGSRKQGNIGTFLDDYHISLHELQHAKQFQKKYSTWKDKSPADIPSIQQKLAYNQVKNNYEDEQWRQYIKAIYGGWNTSYTMRGTDQVYDLDANIVGGKDFSGIFGMEYNANSAIEQLSPAPEHYKNRTQGLSQGSYLQQELFSGTASRDEIDSTIEMLGLQPQDFKGLASTIVQHSNSRLFPNRPDVSSKSFEKQLLATIEDSYYGGKLNKFFHKSKKFLNFDVPGFAEGGVIGQAKEYLGEGQFESDVTALQETVAKSGLSGYNRQAGYLGGLLSMGPDVGGINKFIQPIITNVMDGYEDFKSRLGLIAEGEAPSFMVRLLSGILEDILTNSIVGAAIGSVIPGAGTTLGAMIGSATGIISSGTEVSQGASRAMRHAGKYRGMHPETSDFLFGMENGKTPKDAMRYVKQLGGKLLTGPVGFIMDKYRDLFYDDSLQAEGGRFLERAKGYATDVDILEQISGKEIPEFLKDYAKSSGYVFNTGGAVSGPGTGTSDSIPAMLSNGEYVIKASAVSKYGTRALDQLNAGIVPGFKPGGSVSGFNPGDSERYRMATNAIELKGLSDNTSRGLRQIGDILSEMEDGFISVSAGKRQIAQLIEQDKLYKAAHIAAELWSDSLDEATKALLENADAAEGITKSLKAEYESIGQGYAADIESTFRQGMKEGLRTGNFKDFGENLLDSFTGGMVDSFVDGMSDSLFKGSFDPKTGERSGGINSFFGKMFSGQAQAGSRLGGEREAYSMGNLDDNMVGDVVDGATGVFGRMSQGISNAWSSTMGEGGWLSGLLGSVGQIFGGIAEGISGAISSLGGGSGGSGGSGGGIGGLISMGMSLFMNQGGIVPSTPYSQAGKDSVPAMLTPGEMVVPANQVNSFRNGGMGETHNSNFNINVSGDVSRQTRKEIVKMMPQITQGVNGQNKESGRRR